MAGELAQEFAHLTLIRYMYVSLMGQKTKTTRTYGGPTCSRGHIFDQKNTYYYKGIRQCRACRNLVHRMRRRRAKEEISKIRESGNS